ncbi:MAG: tRNA dihydrouridine(20/20a) synthase DusA, partial [Alphaproteobacteria bacterium]|nr:tRNA dihydrouridine(20/20a) synthase DusA [Alphaproteobacteria bacterium]
DNSLVHELKRDFPQIPVAINGGILTLEGARAQLEHLDGVMLGRAAYQNPELLLDVDPQIFGEAAPLLNSFAVAEAMYPYIEQQLALGVRLHDITRHMLGLFAGRHGARLWRRHLAVHAPMRGAGLNVLRDALAHVRHDGDLAEIAAE